MVLLREVLLGPVACCKFQFKGVPGAANLVSHRISSLKLNYFRANSDDFEGLENFFRMTLKFPLTFSNKEIMLHKLLCAFVKRASLTKRFFREVHRIFWSHWLPRNVKGVAAMLFFVRIL